MHAHSTTWDHELVTLRDEIFAEGGVTLKQAADMALGQIGALRDYARAWDADADAALVSCYAPCLECPEPTPPAPPQTAAQRKAAYNAARGVKAVRAAGGWLVPSATRNVVHFVSDSGVCSCEAATAQRDCWHTALVGFVDRKVAA